MNHVSVLHHCVSKEGIGDVFENLVINFIMSSNKSCLNHSALIEDFSVSREHGLRTGPEGAVGVAAGIQIGCIALL